MSSRILKRIIELEQQRDDALAALAAAQDRIEDLEQALAKYDHRGGWVKVEYAPDWLDLQDTQDDFLKGTGRM